MVKKIIYTLIFFVCILASCFVTNSVFASVEFNYDSKHTYSIPYEGDHKFHYYFFFSINSDNPQKWGYRLWVTTEPMKLETIDNKGTRVFKAIGVGYTVYWCSVSSWFDKGDECTVDTILDKYIQKEIYSQLSSVDLDELYNNNSFSLSDKRSIPSSEFDDGLYCVTNSIVYDKDDKPLFQVAPQEGAVTQAVKLIDFSTVLQEVLEMLPIILLILIGLIALMKAIKLLFSIFRNV